MVHSHSVTLLLNYRSITNGVVATCRFYNGKLRTRSQRVHFLSHQRCFPRSLTAAFAQRPPDWLFLTAGAQNHDVAARHWWVFCKRRDLSVNAEMQVVVVVPFHCGDREDRGALCLPFPPRKEMGKYAFVVLISAYSKPKRFHMKSNAVCRRFLTVRVRRNEVLVALLVTETIFVAPFCGRSRLKSRSMLICIYLF